MALPPFDKTLKGKGAPRLSLKKWYRKLPRKKKRQLVAAAVILGVPLLLAVVLDWHMGPVSLRYVVAGLGMAALYGWMCVSFCQSERTQMNKQRACTHPVEATVTGYLKKQETDPGADGSVISYSIYAPEFRYSYRGRRSYCLWKYNYFTRKRMQREYPEGQKVTLYIHPEEPDFASLKCGLSKSDKAEHILNMGATILLLGPFVPLGLAVALYEILQPLL